MKTVLLLLFTMHQMFFISNALKCYECEGDCKEPKEKECDAAIKCCFSSVAPVGGAAGGGGGGGGGGAEATTAAETPAPRMKRNIIGGRSEGEVTRRGGFYTEFLDDDTSGTGKAGGGGGAEHKHKGCCSDKITPETCKKDECYMCETDLCNKGSSASSATAVLASILNILLPLAIIGVAIGSPKKFIN